MNNWTILCERSEHDEINKAFFTEFHSLGTV